MIPPKKDEFEPWEGGVRHIPTGIRVYPGYQNERGDWTFKILRGQPGEYVERAVEELGAQLLLEDKFGFDKLSKLNSELMRLECGNIRRMEDHKGGRMKDVTQERIAHLKSEIAKLKKRH